MHEVHYFDQEKAIAQFAGGNIETVLETVACRYIGANPRYEYSAFPFFTGGIIRNKDYRYEADFAKIFPDAPLGSYVYVWGKYRAEVEGALTFTLIPSGPVKLWMNGEKIFGSTVESERYDREPQTFDLPLNKGWNHLVLRFTRTAAGFGAEFGTHVGKMCYYFFRGLDRGPASFMTEGFDYTTPLSAALGEPTPENLAPLCAPLPSWTEEEKKRGVFGRIFPEAVPGDRVLARTEILLPVPEGDLRSLTLARREVPAALTFSGYQSGNCRLYAGNTLLKSFVEGGSFQFDYELEAGRTALAVLSTCPDGAPWDFSLQLKAAANSPGANASSTFTLKNPFFNDDAAALPWIFAGPFRETPAEELAGVTAPAFDRDLLVGRDAEKTFWRLDMPGAWVRLYNNNPLYGHWTYPLGVTLYGLIETARYFEREGGKAADGGSALGAAIGSYVEAHANKSLRTLEYALFDKERFGGATAVHHHLTSLDSLDDCGSFASTILELAKDRNLAGWQAAVELSAEHILRKQDRREEGCFWRRRMMHHAQNETLWADDLYMSVPFLCRYGRLKNDPSILDTAALQFEGFRKYLFLEDISLMAHVYDFRRGMNTGIPWGRGNGWTIFSLTELLMVLPEDHPRRPGLLDFYKIFAAGILARQDENGMWRQVLNMPSSYIESSCTAMFICAFSRGIRYGWLSREDAHRYQTAAEKAWRALERYSIDSGGNVHGVCRGSEFGFNPRYYAEHLLPRLNDTHGIGIVLLAGLELLKLKGVKAGNRE